MTDKVKIVLEFLKLNGTITDLEKDIWDTADKIVKQPFSREEVQKKVADNFRNHWDIIIPVAAAMGGAVSPLEQLPDDVLRDNLYAQLIKLCEKEDEELKKRIGQEWQNRQGTLNELRSNPKPGNAAQLYGKLIQQLFSP